MQTFVNINLRSVWQKIVFLLSLSWLCLHAGFSQAGLQHIKEAIYLRTDRDLYVVGEQVWMKVNKLNAHNSKPDNISKVVYIELLNQYGYPVNQLKLHVPERSGFASFTLADTLSSGNYLLRSYTSWMKNSPAKDFSFRTISVINPFRNIEKIGVRKSAQGLEDVETGQLVRTDNGLLLELEYDRSSYGTREGVQVTIQARDSSGNPVEADLSVSVARSYLFNDQRGSFPDPISSSARIEPDNPGPYLPELEGVVLSGILLNSTTDGPIGNEDIVLSIVGKAARCQFYRTNDSGKFYFNLDNSGVQELVIQPLDTALSDYYVELEPDFLNVYDHPLPGPLYLDTTIIQALNRGIVAMQIENIYERYRHARPACAPERLEYNFYGDADYHVQISDYIPLKTIREVIKEIVPMVSVREKDGQNSLIVENGVVGVDFNSGALILVDGVPFDDVDQILNISLRELESIEVVNLRYFLDGHVFEGIIHFVTVDGKMAGLEVDRAVFRQAFGAFSEESCFTSPVYNSDSLKSNPLPDFRNTLYWNPDLHTGEKGYTSFEFYTADETGYYTVFVEGISPDGKSAYIYKKLLVH
jgi:hypothetical protein